MTNELFRTARELVEGCHSTRAIDFVNGLVSEMTKIASPNWHANVTRALCELEDDDFATDTLEYLNAFVKALELAYQSK